MSSPKRNTETAQEQDEQMYAEAEASQAIDRGDADEAPDPSTPEVTSRSEVISSTDKGPSPTVPKASDLFLLARQQNFKVLSKLLEAYPQHWDARDDDGHSLMHWAALVGDTPFLQECLQKGVPVDVQASNRQTPLMWAVIRDWIPAARALLNAKATLNGKDSLGATPLMIAVQHRSYKSMLLLMHKGADIRPNMLADGDKNGCTSAHWAAYKGDLTALKLLNYFNTDLNALDSSKMLPLHRAVCASQSIVVDFLIEHKSDPHAKNADGKTVMDIAQEKQDNNMQALLKKLIQKSTPSSGGGNKVDVQDLEAGESKEATKEGKGKGGIFKSLMKDKAAHKLFPVFWLVCVSMSMFCYIMDLRAVSYEAAPTSSMLLELLVPVCLVIFSFVALGDAGAIPSRPLGNSGVEELMKKLDSNTDEVTDIDRLCTTTWVLKGLRTKYCKELDACVEEFDHYCVWLNNTIGKGNHRQFVALAITEFISQIVFLRVSWCIATTVVKYESFGQWTYGAITALPLLSILVFVHCLTAPWVLMLTIHQGRLILHNLTTNEMMNMHRYEHFWVTKSVMPGHAQRMFQNPFCKGSMTANCLDFWWYRQRSLAVPQPEPKMSQQPCCNHSHGHGGHGHSH
eukprot:TRINITY_DN32961_c0_g1_i1.p1 TRINITY_DN32961_c0_g1~~TRINITY_DN32961_c0_g1_i1.p1  ORF type:complete len:627 (-),score=124.81 TRINITY_DN32961_c0_g1_i1:92-1972(-)